MTLLLHWRVARSTLCNFRVNSRLNLIRLVTIQCVVVRHLAMLNMNAVFASLYGEGDDCTIAHGHSIVASLEHDTSVLRGTRRSGIAATPGLGDAATRATDDYISAKLWPLSERYISCMMCITFTLRSIGQCHITVATEDWWFLITVVPLPALTCCVPALS